MKKRLAIKGHPTRGKEVIELLEMMGGVNVDSHKGHFPDEWKSSYYIYGDSTIQFAGDEFLLKLNFVIFTLEEFLEKFPFKVGDKVYIKVDPNANCLGSEKLYGEIESAVWVEEFGYVVYKLKGCGVIFHREELHSYKEEVNMKEKNLYKIAFMGDKDHGCDIISTLESWGGSNNYSRIGNDPEYVYFINDLGTIDFIHNSALLAEEMKNFYFLFWHDYNIECHLKVGESINYGGQDYDVDSILYDANNRCIVYKLKSFGIGVEYITNNELTPTEEWQTEEENSEYLTKNTMEKNLAIKGHPTRGEEVVEILEMMGGHNNKPSLLCNSSYLSYYIGNNNIQGISSHNGEYAVYTLEEFLEKYPFKVGDKVKLYYQDEENDRYCSAIPSTIIGMRWDKSCEEVAYKMKDIERECYRNEISYDNKDNSNEPDAVISDINLNRTDYADEVEINLGDYEIEVRDGRTFAVLKKPTYPTNYQECCQVLGLPMQNALEYINKDCNKHDYYNDLQSTLNCFVSLKICRDAYWKIAGEQMGLGKLWKPDFTNDDEERYGIYTAANKVVKDFCGVGDVNTILTFPTEEMRDIFYENFKDLIEQCKEFL